MPFTLPDLANVYNDDGSELSRKFGRGLTNYYSGSPLNRLSFLRRDSSFLTAAFSSPQAQFVILNDFAPLVHNVTKLRCLAAEDVTPVTGTEPFKRSEKEAEKLSNSTALQGPLIIFLGIWEEEETSNGEDDSQRFQYREFRGQPWFAVDVTPKGSYAQAAQALITRFETKEGEGEGEGEGEPGSFFLKSTRQNSLTAIHAAIYGQARAMIDWNTRNRFCATCGLPTFSTHAGYKRICPGINLAGSSSSDPQQKPGHDCPTRTSVSNISFPRSDPTMIAAVISHDGTRVLLGRQRRWPTGFYSVLAGFLEPGESLEEAVRREVFEEAGVRVGRVVLHSTQPWPYPASLMIGAIASALPGKGEEIHTGHDDELEDARWVSMEEIKETLGRPVVNLGGMKPNGVGGREGKEDGEKGMLLPPHTAIANRLLTAVVEGFGRLDGAANI